MSASTKVYVGKMTAESASESEIKDRFSDFGEIIGEPVIKSNSQFHYAFIVCSFTFFSKKKKKKKKKEA
jgi:hypothetical protein